MIYVEVHGSSSLKSWSHVILATSTVTLCACGAGICTNINNALVRSSRAFTITSMGLYRPVFHPVLFYHEACVEFFNCPWWREVASVTKSSQSVCGGSAA